MLVPIITRRAQLCAVLQRKCPRIQLEMEVSLPPRPGKRPREEESVGDVEVLESGIDVLGGAGAEEQAAGGADAGAQAGGGGLSDEEAGDEEEAVPDIIVSPGTPVLQSALKKRRVDQDDGDAGGADGVEEAQASSKPKPRVRWASDDKLVQMRYIESREAAKRKARAIQMPSVERFVRTHAKTMEISNVWFCPKLLQFDREIRERMEARGRDSVVAVEETERQHAVMESVYPKLQNIPFTPTDPPMESEVDDKQTPIIPFGDVIAAPSVLNVSMNTSAPRLSGVGTPSSTTGTSMVTSAPFPVNDSSSSNNSNNNITSAAGATSTPGVSNDSGQLLAALMGNPNLLASLLKSVSSSQPLPPTGATAPVAPSGGAGAGVPPTPYNVAPPVQPQNQHRQPLASNPTHASNAPYHAPPPSQPPQQVQHHQAFQQQVAPPAPTPTLAPPLYHQQQQLQQHNQYQHHAYNQQQQQQQQRLPYNQHHHQQAQHQHQQVQPHKHGSLPPRMSHGVPNHAVYRKKPCIWYASPQGCKHGANCRFLHDPSRRPTEADYQNYRRERRS